MAPGLDPTERRPLLLQACLGGAGFAADTLAETLLLTTFGAVWLPIGLAGAALLSLGLTTLLARRPAAPRRLVGLATAAAGVGIVLGIGLVLTPTIAVVLIVLLTRPLRDALLVAAGNLLTERHDPRTAKRLLPRLAAAGQAGAVATGCLLTVLLTLGGMPLAIWSWPILLAAAAWLASRLHARPTPSGLEKASTEQSLHISRPATGSPLLTALTLAVVMGTATTATLGFVAASELTNLVPDASALGSLYAVTGASAGVMILITQAVVLPWLLRHSGTSALVTLPSLLAGGLAAGLWLLPGLPTALGAHLGRLLLRPALQIPVEELLLGLLPANQRGAGRAWLRGVTTPATGLVTCLGLAVLSGVMIAPAVMAIIALVMALAGIGTGLLVRHRYRQAALALVRDGQQLATRRTLPPLGTADTEVVDELVGRLDASANDTEQRLLLALLIDLAPRTAVGSAGRLLARVESPQQAALVMLVAEHRLAAQAFAPLATGLLASPSAPVRRAALAALTMSDSLPGEAVMALLDDPDADTAVAAARLLSQHPGQPGQAARTRLQTIAKIGSEAARAAVAQPLALVEPAALASLLIDPRPAVRQAAVVAATSLMTVPAPLVAALHQAAGDPAAAVRAVTMTGLSRLGASTLPLLAAGLDDPVAAVRTAAAMAILTRPFAMGELTPLLLGAVGWGRIARLALLTRQMRWRWQTELAREEYDHMAGLAGLQRALAELGPARGPAGRLLRRDLADQVAEGLARWHEGLILTEGETTAIAIRQGLVAPEASDRARAVEALEAVRRPDLAHLVAHLSLSAAPSPGMEAPEAAGAPGASAIPAALALPALSAGSLIVTGVSPWRRVLVTAAGREESLPAIALEREEIAMLSMVERAILIGGVPLFADLPSEQLRLLAGAAEEREIAAGETLVSIGEPGDWLYVIGTGQIAQEEQRGSAGSIARVDTLGPGAALGEDAVFDGAPHILSAVAVTDCQLLALRREVLLALLEEQPALARALITWLSARLRETSSRLAEKTRARPRSVVNLLDRLGELGTK